MSEKPTIRPSVHVTSTWDDNHRLTLSPGLEGELFVVFGHGREVKHVEIVPMDAFLAAVRQLQEASE